MEKQYIRTGECKMCGYCCRNLCVEVEAEPSKDELKNEKTKKQYVKELKEEQIEEFQDEGYVKIVPGKARWNCKTVKVDFVLTCPHIKKDNKCALITTDQRYTLEDKRPEYCKEYPTYGVPKVKTCGYKFKKKI